MCSQWHWEILVCKDDDNNLSAYRYVLLKERNMIMTMEEEYKSQSELFPNPERLEKV